MGTNYHSTRTLKMKHAGSECQYCRQSIPVGSAARRYHGRGQYNPYVHEACAKAREAYAQ